MMGVWWVREVRKHCAVQDVPDPIEKLSLLRGVVVPLATLHVSGRTSDFYVCDVSTAADAVLSDASVSPCIQTAHRRTSERPWSNIL